ncbi:heme-binding protein [Candidatus Njordibacter sp. Uisw_039]|jgi:hypothetical protein|uniref:SOUL family heme-binding protein n=1 Tax=Candidatus Njordibacter sp. Uisw_039 TaxID=3230972 RepID=UPI003A45901D|tara:strand:+ start:533 stop:1150 length:618 start_codon:yes stop_codon:yes gene_type:complete
MVKRLLLGLITVLLTEYSMAIEEPTYTVIEATEAFELRAYEPMIVAETRVSGTLDEASRAGFKIIAGYIFGDNTSSSSVNDKISMTAPVSMQLQAEKINMTAPVSMQQNDGQWLVHFVMPEKYTLDTLPTPNNPAVKLRELPAHNYAVIRFSGFTGAIKVDKKITELMTWLRDKGIKPISEPEMARYNAPWSLPFMRRNEIMVRY